MDIPQLLLNLNRLLKKGAGAVPIIFLRVGITQVAICAGHPVAIPYRLKHLKRVPKKCDGSVPLFFAGVDQAQVAEDQSHPVCIP